MVGGASGSDALREQESKRDMREMPSPWEWWMRIMLVDSASEVLTLRRDSIFGSSTGTLTWLSKFTSV
ncbi:hypothetical protein GH714_016337 [Hevea brasiliensis]|uniref:Uncharacterized protein n=1 Tax=Hevea brasiliensis TaxID=3981 RepID=A0A6A6L6Q9_HEVBR|nr:hypothetical protein GH714_016337 [Hevea brasiliensis]